MLDKKELQDALLRQKKTLAGKMHTADIAQAGKTPGQLAETPMHKRFGIVERGPQGLALREQEKGFLGPETAVAVHGPGFRKPFEETTSRLDVEQQYGALSRVPRVNVGPTGVAQPATLGQRVGERIRAGGVVAPSVAAPAAPVVPEFTGANRADFDVPSEGNFAGTTAKGGTFSVARFWTPEMQEQLDQLRSEGYGAGRVTRQKERAQAASARPGRTSEWERKLQLRNLRRGMDTTERRHEGRRSRQERMARNELIEKQIADLSRGFAAEDASRQAFDVARMEQKAGAEADQMRVQTGLQRDMLQSQLREGRDIRSEQRETQRAREEAAFQYDPVARSHFENFVSKYGDRERALTELQKIMANKPADQDLGEAIREHFEQMGAG